MNITYRLKFLKNLWIRSRFHYFRMAMLRPPYWVLANGRSSRIFAGHDSGSATCYREIIVEDCYDLFNFAKRSMPLVIVDIGANIGMFSKLCSLLFEDADIYAYEPDPAALTWLEQNAESTRIQVFPCAVGEQSGVVMLNAECDSTIGRISQEGSLAVKCMAASELAEGRKIDLLKMDCEGSEWSILQDTSLLKRTQYFCLEYHLYDNHTVEELQDLIEKSGHRILRTSSNSAYGGKFGLLWSTQVSTTA